MKELGYGKDYKYPHEFPATVVDQEYFPESLEGRRYYHPADSGFESEIKKRMAEWKNRRSVLRSRSEKKGAGGTGKTRAKESDKSGRRTKGSRD
jgi:hypothetical protein